MKCISSRPRPAHAPLADAVAITKMFGQVITDLSWNSDGSALLIASLDGSLGVVKFDENEIGQRLSQAEANNHLLGLYGDVFTTAASAGNALIEDPAMLDLAGSRSLGSTKPFVAPAPQQPRSSPAPSLDANAKPTARVVQSVGNTNVVSIETATGSLEQLVTTSKTGRKRIQPLPLNASEVGASGDAQFSSSVPAPVGSPLPVPATPLAAGGAIGAGGGQSPITPSSIFRSEAFPALPGSSNSTYIHKKRKRDEAAAVGLASDRDDSSSSSSGDEDDMSRKKSKKRRRLDYASDDSDVAMNDTGAHADVVNPFGYAAPAEQRRATSRTSGRAVQLPVVFLRPPTLAAAGSRFVRELALTPTQAQSFCLTPEVAAAAAAAATGGAADGDSLAQTGRPSTLALEVTHSEEPLVGNISFISCLADSVVLWKDRLKSQICVAAVSTHYAAVGSVSGEIQLYSIAGRRLVTGIVIGSSVCFLEFSTNSPHLAAVCADGQFFVWNVESMVLEVGGSISSILLVGKTELSKILLSNDALVAVLKSGDSFTYHPNLKCWTRIYDELSFVASNFWSPNRVTTTPGPLHSLFVRKLVISLFALLTPVP